MTFDISLHEVCVRVGVRYVITKFSRMDSLPNFLTHGAPQAGASRARELRYEAKYREIMSWRTVFPLASAAATTSNGTSSFQCLHQSLALDA